MWNAKSYRQFARYVDDHDREIIEFLIEIKLLKPLGKCSRCRRDLNLIRNTHYKGNYAARCPRCSQFSSLCIGTFFEATRLSINNILEIFFCWSKGFTQTQCCNMTGISRASVNQFYRFIRDILSWKLCQEEDAFLFGGPGNIVQIDESVVAKRKYNRGRRVQQKWVLGIYDVTLKKGLAIYVPQRDANTLIPIIQQHVRPGSTIYTDQWAAYRRLGRLGYNHMTVNHSRHFKDPITGVCTNAVEGFWRTMKGFLRRKCIENNILLEEHIDEFMWLQTYGGKGVNVFSFAEAGSRTVPCLIV